MIECQMRQATEMAVKDEAAITWGHHADLSHIYDTPGLLVHELFATTPPRLGCSQSGCLLLVMESRLMVLTNCRDCLVTQQ